MQVVRADLVFSALGLRVPKRSHLGLTGSPSRASTCAPSAPGLGQLPGGASELTHRWFDHYPHAALPTARRKRSMAAGRSGVIEPAQVAVRW
jgi:hypothetical protein